MPDPLDPQADTLRPPSIPTLVWCLHCHQQYDSWKMEWRVVDCHDGQQRGFWYCGTEGCDGAGFGFDIFPVDEDYVDPDGRDLGHWVDDPPPDPATDLDRPPPEPTPVRCEKCGREYSSSDMVWWVDEDCPEDAFQMSGWMCPTKGCQSTGFGHDIRPTDPNYVDSHGRRFLLPGETWETKYPSGFHDDDIPF